MATTPNKFLIYGSDRFLVKHFTDKVLQSITNGTDNIKPTVFDFEKLEPDKLLAELKVFTQSKTLFNTQVKVALIQNAWSPADKRKPIFDFIDEALAKSIFFIWQEFYTIPRLPKLDGWKVYKAHFSRVTEFKDWIKSYLSEYNVKLEPPGLLTLLADQATLIEKNNKLFSTGTVINYLNKAMALSQNQPITEDILRQVFPPQGQSTTWQLLDLLFSNDNSAKENTLNQLLSQNTDPIFILNLLVDQVRSLLAIVDLLENNTNPRAVTKEMLKLRKPPFVTNKYLATIRRKELTKPFLAKLYDKLATLDLNIKTGKIEPEMAIKLFLLRL